MAIHTGSRPEGTPAPNKCKRCGAGVAQWLHCTAKPCGPLVHDEHDKPGPFEPDLPQARHGWRPYAAKCAGVLS